MGKSSYSHSVDTKEKIVSIEDNDNGMSVTNNIENVVAEIKSLHPGIFKVPFMWIYRDTNGDWDGWDDAKQDFVPLMTRNRSQAIERIKIYHASKSEYNGE